MWLDNETCCERLRSHPAAARPRGRERRGGTGGMFISPWAPFGSGWILFKPRTRAVGLQSISVSTWTCLGPGHWAKYGFGLDWDVVKMTNVLSFLLKTFHKKYILLLGNWFITGAMHKRSHLVKSWPRKESWLSCLILASTRCWLDLGVVLVCILDSAALDYILNRKPQPCTCGESFSTHTSSSSSLNNMNAELVKSTTHGSIPDEFKKKIRIDINCT